MFKTERTVERTKIACSKRASATSCSSAGARRRCSRARSDRMVMGAAVVLAAHAPKRVRVVVDGAVHVGPALFEGGGMGAGVGGRF